MIGGHLGRHLELHLSAPHLECLPKFFFQSPTGPLQGSRVKIRGHMIAQIEDPPDGPQDYDSHHSLSDIVQPFFVCSSSSVFSFCYSKKLPSLIYQIVYHPFGRYKKT